MNATKEQLIKGLARYIDMEIVHRVNDVPLKIMLEAATQLAMKQNSFDSILENEIVKGMLTDEHGLYTVDSLEEALEYAMNEHGNLVVRIPGIKFLSPGDKEMTFTRDDVRKMRDYICQM